VKKKLSFVVPGVFGDTLSLGAECSSAGGRQLIIYARSPCWGTVYGAPTSS